MTGDEKWKGQQQDGSSVSIQWSPSGQEVSLSSDSFLPMYFVAPGTPHPPPPLHLHSQSAIVLKHCSSGSRVSEKFLGNQILSYGQNLSLNFRVERRDNRLSAEDLILEGANMRVAVPLIAQGNAYPNENMQRYVFR